MTSNKTDDFALEKAPLGQKSKYISTYTASLLFPISRQIKRDEIGILDSLPFSGFDLWNAFEVSWLNKKGKPVVAIITFVFPAESPNIIESKSFKLYLNSFNQTPFSSESDVLNVLKKDLFDASKSVVDVKIYLREEFERFQVENFEGVSLDELDIETNVYSPCPDFLTSGTEVVEEVIYSDLLKSNCLVTGQPDWGSVVVKYKGKKIDHEGLLKYIISFREHNEFHEQCIERIFTDVMRVCKPEKLSVYGRYTRRGGLDINPFRTNCGDVMGNVRTARQ